LNADSSELTDALKAVHADTLDLRRQVVAPTRCQGRRTPAVELNPTT
jgi:hypothetical protein